MPLALLVGLLLSSCNIQQNIDLRAEGSGTMSLSLAIPSYMQENFDILAQSLPGGDELLKPETIAEELRKTPDISNVKVTSSKSGQYDISFAFANFNQSKVPENQDVFSWRKNANGSTTVSIRLSRSSYLLLEERLPSLQDNTIFQLYGPSSTEGMSRSDYLDMIEYSFGAQARRDLPKANLQLAVSVPGRVISQQGGRLQGRDKVNFTLPLLDLALLDKTKVFSITYQ